jgi:hypothetical protein
MTVRCTGIARKKYGRVDCELGRREGRHASHTEFVARDVFAPHRGVRGDDHRDRPHYGSSLP